MSHPLSPNQNEIDFLVKLAQKKPTLEDLKRIDAWLDAQYQQELRYLDAASSPVTKTNLLMSRHGLSPGERAFKRADINKMVIKKDSKGDYLDYEN